MATSPQSQSTVRRYRQSPFHKPLKRVPGAGPQPCRCMLIAEKPGEREAMASVPRPFIGPAGDYLNVLLSASNVKRSSLYLTNLVKEFTFYSKPTSEEIDRDHQELVDEILACDPEIIGLVGGYAVEHVLLDRDRAEMDKTSGIPIHVDALFGGELRRAGGWIVIPLTHPAICTHAPDSMPRVLDDYLTLGKLLDGEITVREDDPYRGREQYRTLRGAEVATVLPAHCHGVAIDTEAALGKPWSMQFAITPGVAYLIKADDAEGLAIFQEWNSRVRPHIYLHNALFDLIPLAQMGITFLDDQYSDSMLQAYELQVVPQSLKSLAYRYCGAERSSYDEMVSPAQEQISLDYLFHVIANADHFPKPEARIITKAGKPVVYKPQSIDRRVSKILTDYYDYQNHERDEPVDLLDRWSKIDDELKYPVVEFMGDMRHADLSDIDYARAEFYACSDATDTLRIAPHLREKIRAMDLVKASTVDHGVLPIINRMQEVGIKIAPKEFWDRIEDQCDTQMDSSKWKIFEMTGHDINPASGDQVADLLYGNGKGQLGLTPPYLTDSGSRGAVDGVAMESLLSEAPVVQFVMDYTEANKIKGTYVVPLRKLAMLGERVHSTMRLTRTTTGRLSMADPPLHQIPILSDLGKQLRHGFIAEDGFVIGDWDLNQIEMRICAHESRDIELCGMFNRGEDVHTQTACKIFSVSRSVLATDPRTGKVNDYRRTVAKHAAFGIINGITEHGLVNYMILNRCRRPDGQPWTIDDCVMLLKEWFHIYKGVKRLHNDSIAETRETGLARETISGRLIYLPQVWSPNKKVRETAERMSYVMKTQGGAAALFKKVLKEVWGYIRTMPDVKPLFWMHDELAGEVPDREEDRVTMDQIVKWCMESTVKLRVPVLADGGYGMSWGEAH